MHAHAARLVVVSGPDQGRALALGERPVVVGRDPDSDLPLTDDYASRAHCRLEPTADGWRVRDLGSKNGTLIGDEAVQGDRALRDGAELTVGHSRLRFHLAPGPTRTATDLPAAVLDLALEPATREVTLDGRPLEPPLSPKQWALLAALHDRRGEVVTKDELAHAVWPEAAGAVYDYQVDRLVSRLRERLGSAGRDLIETRWGVGFRLR